MKQIFKALTLASLIILLSTCDAPKKEETEAFEFTAYLDNIIQDWEGQSEFIEEYKKLTGINLNIIQPPTSSIWKNCLSVLQNQILLSFAKYFLNIYHS